MSKSYGSMAATGDEAAAEAPSTGEPPKPAARRSHHQRTYTTTRRVISSQGPYATISTTSLHSSTSQHYSGSLTVVTGADDESAQGSQLVASQQQQQSQSQTTTTAQLLLQQLNESTALRFQQQQQQRESALVAGGGRDQVQGADRRYVATAIATAAAASVRARRELSPSSPSPPQNGSRLSALADTHNSQPPSQLHLQQSHRQASFLMTSLTSSSSVAGSLQEAKQRESVQSSDTSTSGGYTLVGATSLSPKMDTGGDSPASTDSDGGANRSKSPKGDSKSGFKLEHNKNPTEGRKSPSSSSSSWPRLPNTADKLIKQEEQTSVKPTSLALPTSFLRQEDETRPYPKKVLFIVANEFCERFSYYGLRTVLVLYFKSVLGFTDSTATVSFHLFAALCYLTPILGAILGDSLWGKFNTILRLSLVYFMGELLLVGASVFWDQGSLSTWTTFLGLFLIGLGTGGIKPCVSALGGDQFYPHEERRRQTFFSLFYGAINLGSLISMFLTPMLRADFQCVNRSDCYPYAFGLPCFLMLVAIVVFLLAKNQYYLVPLPEKNVIVAFCQCLWLALRRKISKKRPINLPNPQLPAMSSKSHQDDSSASSSTLSVGTTSTTNNEQALVVSKTKTSHNTRTPLKNFSKKGQTTDRDVAQPTPNDRNHWLYLAGDRFSQDEIEDFRSVLRILLLFLPIPMYWCLFDQQSSLWTLQATRMDGRFFNTNFVLEPDQMGVANPLLLLLAIPLFEILIYPSLKRFNLLSRPTHRMAAGGLLAALTFVISAMIEVQIQSHLPTSLPAAGQANLLLINGLGQCQIQSPAISHLHSAPQASYNESLLGTVADTTPGKIDQLAPLASQIFQLPLYAEVEENHTANSYQLKFKIGQHLAPATLALAINSTYSPCPLEPLTNYTIDFGLPVQREPISKLLYLEQGNGRLSYRIFEESLALPGSGQARIRLLYEFFGSSSQAEKAQFGLARASNPSTGSSSSKLQFYRANRDGQVIISEYLDVDVKPKGEFFHLGCSTCSSMSQQLNQHRVWLEPGTRNLVLIHQKDPTSLEVKHELLQDNKYRISILYQLIPYLLISLSEVMFSITGLEFSYSMAPETMKSVILGAWSLTTAFGNLFTVAFESMHLFSNIAYDFLFYAFIMLLDMLLFIWIDHHYYRPRGTSRR